MEKDSILLNLLKSKIEQLSEQLGIVSEDVSAEDLEMEINEFKNEIKESLDMVKQADHELVILERHQKKLKKKLAETNEAIADYHKIKKNCLEAIETIKDTIIIAEGHKESLETDDPEKIIQIFRKTMQAQSTYKDDISTICN